MIEIYVNYEGRSYGFSTASKSYKINGSVTGSLVADRVHLQFATPTPNFSPSSREGSGFARVRSAQLSLTVEKAELLATELLKAISKTRTGQSSADFSF